MRLRLVTLADDVRAVPPDKAGASWRLEETSTHADIETGELTAPVKDWSGVLRHFGLDPAEFEVVDDTVKMSSWQQSKRTESGDRDLVWLYAYKARFARRTAEGVELDALADAWRKKLLSIALPPKAKKPRGKAATYSMLIGDSQLGKKGTGESIENWRGGLLRHLDRLDRLVDTGHHKIEGLHLGFMGDETEGYANNYPNQPHTIEMNYSKQLELDFSLRLWSIEQAASRGLPVLVTSVISNHGEMTRNGSKDPVTTKADNASTMVARLVRDATSRIPGFERVTHNIADGNPDIVVDVSGTRTLLSHGHIAKGRGSSTEQRTKNAIERQQLARMSELADVKLYIVAHYHHDYHLEFQGNTLWGIPALEAERSSEYMLDQYGVWSRPGMLGMLIGTGAGPRGWAEVEVL